VDAALVDRARAGDEEAFRQLVDIHRSGLALHCYQILGSSQDADDVVQEVLVAAWQGLRGFEARSSLRTWLYRIATNRCLNALRSSHRHQRRQALGLDSDVPEPNRIGEVVWLEPFPDDRLSDVIDPAPGPEARYEGREAISLAFVTALQLLPPRQRAVLVLRDVLGYSAREAAGMLDSTEASVNSALTRARSNLQHGLGATAGQAPPPAPHSPAERHLVERLTTAYQSGDVKVIVSLLTDDAVLTTPLSPAYYQGREICERFLASCVFRNGRTYRLIATRANGQPAFGVYVNDRVTDIAHANGMLVLTLAGQRICTMTRFDNSVMPQFGLPRTIPI
jgi:RNA polymerase sigma-70 factor (TIGR02960 family)